VPSKGGVACKIRCDDRKVVVFHSVLLPEVKVNFPGCHTAQDLTLHSCITYIYGNRLLICGVVGTKKRDDILGANSVIHV